MKNQTTRKTIVCNYFSGPGAGKSTLAAATFAKLKMLGVNCELITEFAKDKTWEKNAIALSNLLYVLAKQYFRMDRCADKVDVLITDSPIALSPHYNKDPDIHEPLCELALRLANKFDNINYFVKRVKKYNPIGRNESEERAKEIDVELKEMLNNLKIAYTEIDGDILSVDKIVDDVITKLEKNKQKEG